MMITKHFRKPIFAFQASRLRLIPLLLLLLLSGSCSRQALDEEKPSPAAPQGYAEVALGAVAVSDGDVSTRAGVTNPMQTGSTFRLYAFYKGETDFAKIIATRTYTIPDGGEAGVPVMDAGQEQLYLPIGEVDIYLVGPVTVDLNEKDPDMEPNITDVAGAERITPRQGIDLVASRTALTVQGDSRNHFAPVPLEHKMAKMQVWVNRKPDEKNYTSLELKSVTLTNQSMLSSYTFDDTGGTITPTAEGWEEIVLENPVEYLTPPDNTPGQSYYTEALMLPRQEAYMTIGIFFTCVRSGSGSTEERRMESGVFHDKRYESGKVNRFTTNPKVGSELLFRTRLLPWTDTDRGDEVFTDGALFGYSGHSAPVTKDGKRYWPDNSGNGRDAELVGDIRYNAADKYYYAASANAYIRIPPLGDVPAYTLEVVAESKRNLRAAPIAFLDPKVEKYGLKVFLPAEGNTLAFEAGDATRKVSHALADNDKALMEHLAVYAFTCSDTEMAIWRNGQPLGAPLDIQNTDPAAAFNENRLLEWNTVNGSEALKEFRLYDIRLTERVLDPSTLQRNYRTDYASYTGIDVDMDDTKQENITMGCILNQSPVTAGLLPQALGLYQDFTAEVVLTSDGTAGVPLSFHTLADKADKRVLTIYWLKEGRVVIETGGEERIAIEAMNLPYPATQPALLSVRRRGGKLSVRLNGIAVAEVDDPATLLTMRACYIGSLGDNTLPFGGTLHALRFYNRALSEKEQQLNYLVDKRKYNL